MSLHTCTADRPACCAAHCAAPGNACCAPRRPPPHSCMRISLGLPRSLVRELTEGAPHGGRVLEVLQPMVRKAGTIFGFVVFLRRALPELRPAGSWHIPRGCRAH
eukprot:scaffold291335_cov27-Tisochrysis_lutea.AAC.1